VWPYVQAKNRGIMCQERSEKGEKWNTNRIKLHAFFFFFERYTVYIIALCVCVLVILVANLSCIFAWRQPDWSNRVVQWELITSSFVIFFSICA
jgi:hypothetical protein